MSTYFLMECRDANGRVTFSTDIRTIRATAVRVIGSGETGSIPIDQLPSGLDGLSLVPTIGSLTGNTAPYTWTEGGHLHWRGGQGEYYLVTLNVAGLGGTTTL